MGMFSDNRALNLTKPWANLLSVVDFPDEGLPTSPIKGSRGIVAGEWKQRHTGADEI